jgi:hypothetical protein
MKKLIFLFLILGCILFQSFGQKKSKIDVVCLSRPLTKSVNNNYTGNRAPLQPLSFIKLPVGAIKPEGWIRKCLELERDGLAGNLGEISAWLDKANNAWLSKDGQGDHGWEEVPYWLRGYANTGYLLGDRKMISEAETWINAVFQYQRPDGYFGKVNIDKNGRYEIWANMLMLNCLQSYYEYTKDQRVIKTMTDYFKWEMNIPDDKFLKNYWENSRGGDNLASVYWLYNITGESWLLQLAEKIHRNTADWHQESSLPNWHNVNIAECFREPATWWMQSKDSADLLATYNNFWFIRRSFGQVPGGMFGADENARIGYFDPRQGIETCGIVEQMASDEMLIRQTGDLFWAENCEDVAFNTFPAALMPDFKSLRYFTCPNMVLCNNQNHSPGIQNRGPFLMMNPFSSRCCQHNHTMGWPYYAENLWMATPDNGLAAVLFNSCEVKAKVANGSEVALKEETNYPFEEQIRIKLSMTGEVNFPLYIRIPVWCKQLQIKARGKKIPSWTLDKFGLCSVLPAYPAKTNQPEENITLIPMGAARLRISAFPPVR